MHVLRLFPWYLETVCCIALSFQMFPYLFASDYVQMFWSQNWHRGLPSEMLLQYCNDSFDLAVFRRI